jgi:hypothetical protein
VSEFTALRRHFIEMGRLKAFRAENSDVFVTLIVRENDYHIRRSILRRGNERRKNEREDEGDSGKFHL